ncbi:MAG: 50S ribosomal protein L3 [Dehalococcoidia bacterium]|nr:50S ribosomal protein L3 [Dehalococcoidia bacterium]MEC7921224.1 50S ribosomal protein L3 [Chloroflexota bacterium]MEC9450842.1 50S ribosomal protein L3 [Chloroflexota bacterium]MQG04711.1 50S ribosomal protein L3 [SAR202 cluster bacterium]|tara:strand:+ start:12242 stop:12859 length:618 start_codon:yes stop_codon:yes gene_type:complete
MINGLIGRKLKMTTSFDSEKGIAVPVTIVRVGPCKVTQVKTAGKDGYESAQVGFEETKRLNKPLVGHQKRSESNFKYLKEFAVNDIDSIEVGQSLDCGIFEVGDHVSVTGISKGKGFAGTVKRHNFSGGPKTHGQSDRHRAPGSIGAGSSPGRVWKGTKMSGHMGSKRITQKGLRVIKVDIKKNILEIKGSIPGSVSTTLMIEKE